jgi:membrane fusion protein, multidrug efflux system
MTLEVMEDGLMSMIDRKQNRTYRLAWFILLSVPLLSFLFEGCANNSANPERAMKKGMGMAMGAIPVSVAKAAKRDIPIDIQAVANVEAYSTVSVKSQVSGELTQVFFREGESVKKGQDLFAIDARTYEAQLNQAKANLAKDESSLVQIEANLARDLAQQKYAQSEATRYSSLLEKHLVSKEQSEQMNANLDAVSAAVRADQAAIQSARAGIDAAKAAVVNAQVLLGYTRIQSPIDGRTGDIEVQQGNVISPNTVLTTINQITPIYVAFSIPESQLHAAKIGQSVIAVPRDKSLQPENGKLFFIDNAVDAATGTIRIKAFFQNPGHKLWPGEFVQARLRLDTKPNALLIPSQAVQAGQDGSFVFVVKDDRTVESRRVVAGLRVDQDIVIESGLQEGEVVVTEGQLRLAAGSHVQFGK